MSKTSSKHAKPIVVKMRKAHRVFVITAFSVLFLSMLAAMIYIIASSAMEAGIAIMLLAVPVFLFLPLPLHYATWQITLDAGGIQKFLLGIPCKKRPWTQVKEVRSTWLISERSNGIRIIFKDGRSTSFRMDCENAEAAKKRILSHCSITES